MYAIKSYNGLYLTTKYNEPTTICPQHTHTHTTHIQMLPVVTYTFPDLSSKYKIIRSQVISVILLEYTVYPSTQENNIAQKSKWNSTTRLWSRTSKNVHNYFDTSSNLACKFVENPFTVFILQCCRRRDRQIDREADGWAYESTDGRRYIWICCIPGVRTWKLFLFISLYGNWIQTDYLPWLLKERFRGSVWRNS